MKYVDTSIFVAAMTPEPGSESVQRWLEQAEPWSLSVSPWVTAEFASALGIKIRTNQIGTTAAEEARAAYRRMIAGSLISIDIVADDFRSVEMLLVRHETGLRAPDALHIAVANRTNTILATRDSGLARACGMLGLSVESV